MSKQTSKKQLDKINDEVQHFDKSEQLQRTSTTESSTLEKAQIVLQIESGEQKDALRHTKPSESNLLNAAKVNAAIEGGSAEKIKKRLTPTHSDDKTNSVLNDMRKRRSLELQG